MTDWTLNKEGVYGIKKLSDAELGRHKKGESAGKESGQTHIGLSEKILGFLPIVFDPAFIDAKLFYKDQISDVCIKWKWIKDGNKQSATTIIDPKTGEIVHMRSPGIDKGLPSEPQTLTKYIVEEASYDKTTEWYLLFFGLKCNTPMFILIKQGTEIYDYAVDCGLITSTRCKPIEYDEPFYNILNYITEKTGVSFKMNTFSAPKNQILFGPPGTGKTYITKEKAVSIIEWEERCSDDQQLAIDYLKYIKENRIGFVTFHQSYSYEDFIEGIRPVLGEEELNYELMPGIFKRMCIRAAANPSNNYVLIIDEINRGNISRIFGELITLIEPSKRLGVRIAYELFQQQFKDGYVLDPDEKYEDNDETLELESTIVELPYSHDLFGVPNNLYIIATMNTADHSLVSLDTAIRRRFNFVEMLPDTTLLSNKIIEGVDLKKLLDTINDRIIQVFDREHTIGHSYLIKVKTIGDLKSAFENNIVPLLQEYFYNDYSKIAIILSRADKSGSDFIKAIEYIDGVVDDPRPNYELKSYDGPEKYIAIYQTPKEEQAESKDQ